MHVGVNLAAPPESGGTYQYCLSVVHALDPRLTGWEATAFVEDPAWRSILPPGFLMETVSAPRAYTALSAAYRLVDHSISAYRRSAVVLPGIRALDRSGCDLIVFPSQEPASCQTRKPALAAVHDLMHRYESQFEEYRGGVFARRERHYRGVCAAAAGILADSELGKRQIIESYGVSPAKVFVLPFAPPAYLTQSGAVDVEAKYELPKRYLFYPAQFWEHKNHIRLVEALAVVKNRGLPVKLVLVGSKKHAYRRVVSRVEELGLAGDVRILGYVPNEDMAALYRQATATVFISQIGPTSIPPLEAMAVGSPLIVSDIYAMPEQVGDAALLVDPTSVEDIADKIEQVWCDEALRRQLIENGFVRSAAWTEEHFGARLRQIIASAADVLR